MRALFLVFPVLAAGPALAQSFCIAPDPTRVDPCIVGSWEVNSDMAAKMQAILDSVPASMRTQFEAQVDPMMGKNLFISIFSDGFYTASYLTGEINGRFFSDKGETTFTMSIMSTPNSGWLVLNGGSIGFCMNEGGGDTADVEAESQTRLYEPDTAPDKDIWDEASFGGADARHGPAPVNYDLPYTCSGNTMQMRIKLPDPINWVTYDMRKVAAGRMGTAFREAYERRFDF